MHITLISPRLTVQKGDFLGSGVPYWPIELAVFAAVLRNLGEDVSVIDLFGANTAKLTSIGQYYLQGRSIRDYYDTDELLSSDVIIVYAISYMSHQELLSITRCIRVVRPLVPIVILENSQAVTGYSLQRLSDVFFSSGATAIICGEPHFNWPEIESYLTSTKTAPAPHNLITRSSTKSIKRTIVKASHYPVPAWDLFNLEGYWSLPYAHGPKTARFFPILTSRGCPYPCDFCVVPETNERRWRSRPPRDVVDEIIELRDRYGVRDFQIEDLNPTVDHLRWEEICRLLVERKAGIRFYLVSGTKAETVHVDQLPLLARAGCRYISISPESGSEQLMKVIGKPFNYVKGLDLVEACRAHGIKTQACFLVGHPAETEKTFESSVEYLRKLIQAGLDEVAVFIVAPFAGSALYSQGKISVNGELTVASFSPKGRENYIELVRRRRVLIRVFFAEKLKRGTELWLQGFRAIFGRPQTKMENLPWRVAFILWLIAKERLLSLNGHGKR